MEKIFGVSKGITILIIGSSLILILGILSRLIFHRGKTHFQIISPNGDYHITNEIVTDGDCIVFYDELGAKNRVCGSYTIKEI